MNNSIKSQQYSMRVAAVSTKVSYNEILCSSVLALVVLFASLGVVYIKYQSKNYFSKLQALHSLQNTYLLERDRISLEKSTLMSYTRVSNFAKNKLHMVAIKR